MGGVNYKEHLETKFLYCLIPSICRNSEALEEAQGKAKELRKKGYDFVCNEDDLETWVTQTWNEVWEGYNHG
tara:strand:- start:329 stop:544 length:216 start_codon:yes stop_codon:yes gene_type:complete